MKGFTIQNSIDLLEKNSGGGGASPTTVTASAVTYDNTSSGLTADDVQEAIDELSTAGGIKYDNTNSGLTADDVQEAIDEIVNKKPVNLTTTEKVIGTWIDGSILYEKCVDLGAFPNNTSKNVEHGIDSLDKVISLSCVAMASNGQFIMVPLVSTGSSTNQISLGGDGTNLTITTGADRSGFSGYAIIQYTKISQSNNTRSKKK